MNNEVNNQNTNTNSNNLAQDHISLQDVVSNGTVSNSNPIQIDENSINIEETNSLPINNPNPDNKRKLLTDSELLYTFIGNNYQRFIMGKFNFPAFFLSVFYLLFRKMYFYSFIVTVLFIVSNIFIKNPLYLSGVTLTISFIIGLSTNKLYLKHCRNKIDSIRYNSFLDNDLFLQNCRKKGGTSIYSVVFGFVLNIIVIFIFISLYLYFIIKTPINDIPQKIIDYCTNNISIK